MQFIGIIPARYASSRFPGKPLADLSGKPMIQRVYEQASKKLDVVLVATDDERIYTCVKSFGGNVVMTSPEHACGTDRVYEAYLKYHASQCNPLPHDQVVVLNIQGDEPFIQPAQIQALIDCFPTQIATLVHPFDENASLDDLQNPNYVKVAVSHAMDGLRALYFSRSVIPFVRNVASHEWLAKHRFYRHIGMYAYRADVLRDITQLSPSVLEQVECLEQLRWLENGFTVRVAETNHASIGIDTPEDLKKAIEYMNKEELCQ